MGSFKSFGKRGFGGGKRGFGGNGGEKAFMHQATCAQCGKPCEVPFKPTGDRPVYCKECFATRRNTEGGGRPEGKSFGKPMFRNNDKPRFENNHAPAASGVTSAQFAELSGKLDRIINALAKFESVSVPLNTAPAKEIKPKAAKVEKVKKPTKKKTKSKS